MVSSVALPLDAIPFLLWDTSPFRRICCSLLPTSAIVNAVVGPSFLYLLNRASNLP